MNSQDSLPMERRRQARMHTDHPSSLYYPPLGLLQVRISNISDSGLFIRLGNIRLGLYNIAEIIQCVSHHLTAIRAEVVHVSSQGAGLRFIDPDPALIQQLQARQLMLDAANDETGHRLPPQPSSNLH